MSKRTFNIEITDTFGGDANYSWVKRYTYKAKSPNGAIHMLAREHGGGWKYAYDCGDVTRYDLKDCCICAFVSTDWGN